MSAALWGPTAGRGQGTGRCSHSWLVGPGCRQGTWEEEEGTHDGGHSARGCKAGWDPKNGFVDMSDALSTVGEGVARGQLCPPNLPEAPVGGRSRLGLGVLLSWWRGLKQSLLSPETPTQCRPAVKSPPQGLRKHVLNSP